MPSFPLAPKHPKEITQHGQTRIDNYFWMRYREDPEVLTYLHAESDYLDEIMQHTQPLQETLFVEMKARIKEDDASAPEKNGDYDYYTRNEAGKQYPLYCRKNVPDGPEELLLDQNALAEGKTFCRIGSFSVSPDASKLAYSIDPDGSEKCEIFVKNLSTGQLLAEKITNTFGDVYGHSGIEWSNDSQGFLYASLDASQRPYRIHHHLLGSDPASDRLLYEERDETFSLWLAKSRSSAYFMVWARSFTSDEWHILSADQPQGDFQVFDTRRPNIEYNIEHHSDIFFISTNENAQNFKLMKTPASTTSHENWVEVIPHRQDVTIEGLDAFSSHLVIAERQGGFRQLRISAPDAVSNIRYISFPEPVYSFYAHKNPEFDSDTYRITYSSLVTPNSVIDYHIPTGQWQVKKQDEIPSGYDPSQFTSERVYATAPDGVQVPMSIVYKKGLALNGENPTLLYGYGSYGASIDPTFNANRLSLMERGFVYVIGHIRGGSEMGRNWYDNGKMLHKRNTFTDFIACAETLIEKGYTSSAKLAIMGRSAGGLLVGACLAMRPDLFQAVVASVPFVDVINTMSDPTIPLTTMEYDQWGNPENKEYFDYMYSYSPYDNIRPAAYPHILITTGLNDPRVAYWEPAKFTAKLRELKTNDNLVLLKTNYDAGHAGASGRYDYLKEVAFEYAFLIDRLA